jgi:hypothetical protein
VASSVKAGLGLDAGLKAPKPAPNGQLRRRSANVPLSIFQFLPARRRRPAGGAWPLSFILHAALQWLSLLFPKADEAPGNALPVFPAGGPLSIIAAAGWVRGLIHRATI